MAHSLVQSLGPSVFLDGVCEPFAGGASLYFAAHPASALLGDVNKSLITTYKTLRDRPAEIAEALAELPIDASTFQAQRALLPADPVVEATRFIYLNRTAFGGLWRVNQKGEFNVPFGCKSSTRLPTKAELSETSRELEAAEFLCADFRTAVAASTAATIYFDPPYASAALDRERFVRYSDRVFSWSDQVDLANIAAKLASAGHHVLISNGYSRDIRELYDTAAFKVYRITRPTNFAANSSARGPAHELFLMSRHTRFLRLPAGFQPHRSRK
jgi:DNA adenine methylase